MNRPGTFGDAGKLADGTRLTADVCVIGSGAGGAVTAALLAQAGLEVLVLEEGGHYTRADFHMREDEAFPTLYQEQGARTTKDLGMAVLQGRAVGGSTVVNWTTCFRTPERTLDHWRRVHAVSGLDHKTLDPHWDAVEKRLSVHQIPLDETNRNNRTLYDGCKALGLAVDTIHRNVRGCFKSGYCGLGCPVDAKQSMLVTYLPDAVAAGATVLSRCRVDRLETEAGQVRRAHASAIGSDNWHPTGARLVIEARRFILAAGAIGTPAVLMRSGLGGGMVGRGTYLHPVVGTASEWKEPIEPYYGAPQSVASHALAERSGEVGFFFEAAPLQPMMAAIAATGFGDAHHRELAKLPYTSAHIALTIDGFDPSEHGGTVRVRPSGAPILDYPIPPRIWTAFRQATRMLVRIDLAAGALRVYSGHCPPLVFTSERDLAQLDHAPFETNRMAVFTAHIMGGARLGDDPARSVVRSSDLRHHTLANLHVIDGSIFPTSLGVNPQETIYGIAHLMGTRLAQAWS